MIISNVVVIHCLDDYQIEVNIGMTKLLLAQ